MATLYNQIFNPEEGVSKLVVHGVYSMIVEYIDGKVDTNTIKALTDGTPESDSDIDNIASTLDSMSTEEKYQWAIRFHARLLITELKKVSEKPIGFDEPTFKALMGY